ncbi:hypothetical protein [Desulfonatronovibrio magnus]|uniref:hypothetical protein n=1 Tax=Desulfonatronovibrio magnus TaxID=698827 RepID=UPI0005EAEDE6|nr:hypothetical protein [Desulfonatronovibrio magnus]
MSDFGKGLILFSAGLVAGYLGTRIIENPQSKARGLAVGAISQGLDLKERIMTSVEKAKENVEDMVAEARQEKDGKIGIAEAGKETQQ